MEPTQAVLALEDRLAAAGYQTAHASIARHDALVARRSDFRWKWLATRLHTFVVAFTTPELDENLADELTAAAQAYAFTHQGGLRGLGAGAAAIAVFLTQADRHSVHSWFARQPRHGFSVLRFPVLVELESGGLTYLKARLVVGGLLYAGHLRGVVEEVIGPAVQPPPQSDPAR